MRFALVVAIAAAGALAACDDGSSTIPLSETHLSPCPAGGKGEAVFCNARPVGAGALHFYLPDTLRTPPANDGGTFDLEVFDGACSDPLLGDPQTFSVQVKDQTPGTPVVCTIDASIDACQRTTFSCS